MTAVAETSADTFADLPAPIVFTDAAAGKVADAQFAAALPGPHGATSGQRREAQTRGQHLAARGRGEVNHGNAF